MSFFGQDKLSKTAFNELQVVNPQPITQITAQYGLLQNVLTVTDDLISGTNSVIDNKFTCQTGVSAVGLASILTLRQVASRAGQGILARFTAIFDTGIANANQAAGLITAENLFTFGFIGTAFGILFARDGLDELQELTLTVDASGAETATVTIDGVPFNVSLTGSGSLSDDAFEISESLNAQVPNHNFSSNGATVICQAIIPGAMGAYAYSSTGVSAGAWVQIVAGADATIDFIPQASWNVDTRLAGDANSILNPLFNNAYQIQLNGSADFFVEDRETRQQILVHRVMFTNADTLSNVSNSTFRLGWLARNVGNTTDVTVQGGYAASFIEGAIYYDTVPRGDSNTQAIPASPSTQTSVLILRNRLSFGDKVNRAEVLPYLINGSTESNKFASFKLILEPTFSSPVNFSYIDKTSSLVEISKDAVIVTGGLEIGSIIVEAGTPQQITFNTTTKTTTAVYPGSIIAVVCTLQSGGAADCTASVTWQEDL